jgi:thioesterase domain-containing protein
VSAWAGVTTGVVKTYQGDGDHAHMLHQPYLERNAGTIRSILDDAIRRSKSGSRRAAPDYT